MKRSWLLTLLLVTSLTSPASVAAAQAPAEYHFAPGDIIDVTITPQRNFDRTITVQPDGKISFPLAGQLQAAGLSTEELAQKLRDGLKHDLRNPMVTVSLKELSKQIVRRASLLGAVKKPGVFEVKDGTTLAEILALGEGPLKQADLRRVTITRADHTVQTVDLAETDSSGQVKNVPLAPGDTVVVPAGGAPSVLVLGEVTKPGSYEVQPDTRLLEVVSQAGGPTTRADLRRVTLIRSGNAGSQLLDLQPLLIKGDPSSADLNVVVRDGDTVVLTETSERVYVMGRVSKPEVYTFKPGDRVLDALAMAGGAANDGDIGRAILVRREGSGQPVARELDLRKMMAKGKMASNELLRGGDLLFVPDKKAHHSISEIGSLFWPISSLVNLLR